MPKIHGLSQSGFWPSGNPRLYLRRAGYSSIPLPDLARDDPMFETAYKDAVQGIKQFPVATNVSAAKLCLYAVRRARNRAKAKGLPFDLTAETCLEIIHKQRYRCALTRMKFSAIKTAGSPRMPFAPSIDQIAPGAGYTLANSRIVCVIVNTAISDFGDEAFYRMCRGIVTNRELIFPTFGTDFQQAAEKE